MFSSPTALRERGYVFRIYYNEGNEPPHVHVGRAEAEAKFWLSPVALCFQVGFRPSELRWIRDTLRSKQSFFMEQWHDTQARKV